MAEQRVALGIDPTGKPIAIRLTDAGALGISGASDAGGGAIAVDGVLLLGLSDSGRFVPLAVDASGNLQVGTGGGGGGDDPLELQNWLSIGANPAQSGALRLENNAKIVARNHAGDDDIPLIVLTTANHIDINHPDGGRFRLTGNGYATINGLNNAYISIAPTDVIEVAGGNSGAAGLFIAADGSLSLVTDTGKLITLSPLDVPTSDPAVAGAIFSMDGAGLAAALGAGARYLLVSGGP
jgi:hypothetical protein